MPVISVANRNSEESRVILRAMMTDRIVLGRIASEWKPGGFNSDEAEIIGQWCVDYFNQHGKAPKSAITSIFTVWSESHHDQHKIKTVAKILETLSDEHSRADKLDASYVFTLAQQCFTKTKIKKLNETVEGFLSIGKLKEAEDTITSYAKIQAGESIEVQPITDESVMASCFDEESHEPLIKYDGALGVFFTHALERDKFIAIQAPEKAGKTFLLTDIAIRAVQQRRKTAFFGCGDMTEKEMLERIYPRIAKHPILSVDGKWPFTVQIPTKIVAGTIFKEVKDCIPPTVTFKPKDFTKPLTLELTKKACEKFIMNKLRSKENYFNLACYPNDTISAKGIHDVLKRWEIQGFVPDVVIIDYADILAPIDRKKDFREQTNETWKYLRRLSQEYHCLVVTATQADANSYDQSSQDRRNFSDDKRKNAHASGILGINIISSEKELQSMRLNWIIKRTGRSNPKLHCWVAGCLDICDPCIVSTF